MASVHCILCPATMQLSHANAHGPRFYQKRSISRLPSPNLAAVRAQPTPVCRAVVGSKHETASPEAYVSVIKEAAKSQKTNPADVLAALVALEKLKIKASLCGCKPTMSEWELREHASLVITLPHWPA